jgi:hypothetical protein
MIWHFFRKKNKTCNPKGLYVQEKCAQRKTWPVQQKRPAWRWFPAQNRLIAMVHTRMENTVLPPAVVRKASWRE